MTVAISCNVAVMFFYFSLPLLSSIAFFVAITEFLFFLKIVGFFKSVILLKNTFVFKHFHFFSHKLKVIWIKFSYYYQTYQVFMFFLTQVQSDMNQVFILLNFFQLKNGTLSCFQDLSWILSERERERERKRNCLAIFKNICLGIAFYNKTTRSLNIFWKWIRC